MTVNIRTTMDAVAVFKLQAVDREGRSYSVDVDAQQFADRDALEQCLAVACHDILTQVAIDSP
jgi:chorismate mutase